MLEEENKKTQSPLVELIQLLKTVKTDTPEAKLNETTMKRADGVIVKY